MNCFSPITLKNPAKISLTSRITVPCGKCPNCLKSKSIDWAFRLGKELRASSSALFLTLTYSDENIPVTSDGIQTLDKSHLRHFLGDLRNYQRRPYQTTRESRKMSLADTEHVALRFYAIGEYGSKTVRPHYHILLFNLNHFQDFEKTQHLILNKWRLGHIKVGTVTSASIQYVTNYILKKSFHPIGSVAPFATMSKGIGRPYLKNTEYHRTSNSFTVLTEDHQKMRMPRYYRNKIFSKMENDIYNAVTQKMVIESDKELCEQLSRKGREAHSYFDQLREEIKMKFDAKLKKGKL